MKDVHIVVVGGGFGGVYASRDLLRRGYKVTLISQTNYFVFTPLLHEVATGSLHANDITFEYSSFFKSPRFTFYREQVVEIDYESKFVRTLDNETLRYDYLIVSTGSQTNFFNTKGSEHAIELKTIRDAHHMKRRVVELAQGMERDIVVNVVGGGPTGVELALELKEFLNDIKKLSPTLKYKVQLLHSGDTLCANFPDWVHKYALSVMEKKGVEVRLGTFVGEIREDGVLTNEPEFIPGDLTIWSAGVKPSSEMMSASTKDERGNVVVEKTLMIRGRDKEFALGDVATISDEFVPKLAQTAMHQGIVVADNIHRLIQGRELREYVVRADNQLISLGKGCGAANIFGLRFKGLFAWLIWKAAYLSKTPGARNKLEVSGTWLINLFASRDLYER